MVIVKNGHENWLGEVDYVFQEGDLFDYSVKHLYAESKSYLVSRENIVEATPEIFEYAKTEMLRYGSHAFGITHDVSLSITVSDTLDTRLLAKALLMCWMERYTIDNIKMARCKLCRHEQRYSTYKFNHESDCAVLVAKQRVRTIRL